MHNFENFGNWQEIPVFLQEFCWIMEIEMISYITVTLINWIEKVIVMVATTTGMLWGMLPGLTLTDNNCN